jgi:translocation and assembly module TamA
VSRGSARRFFAIALAAVLGACASLGGGTDAAPQIGPDASTAPNAASATADAEAAMHLEIRAPRELRELLNTHLDIARVARSRIGGDEISTAELDRIERATPAQARALLETEGYFDAKVTVTRDTTTPPRTTVSVERGKRSLVGRITFEVQGELERAASDGDADAILTLRQLREGWLLPKGEPFRNTRWTDAKSAVLARLRAEGYAAATWSGTSARADVAANEVRLTLIADSGPRFRVGEVKIEGLDVQDAAPARNLAGFGRGAPATEAALLDYQDRLVRSGLYDQVAVTLDTDNASPESTAVIVRLKESTLQQATVGVGYSANVGPRVSLEHTHRRIFGQRATARNKFEIGRLRQAWDGEVSSHAQPDLYRNLVGGTYERLEATDSGDTVRSVRLRLGRTQETARRERFVFTQLERAERRTALTQQATTAASLNFHAIWRRLDNVVLPTEGASLAVETGVGYARSSQADDGPFGRVAARLGVWQPLPWGFYGHGRIELGQVIARDSVGVPDTQGFRAGGDDSVRGYAYRSLGPTVDGSVASGRVLFSSTLEVARPISEALPSVWWAVFADVGQAAQRWRELDPVWGAGAGLRWRSPVGPLRLDWAYGREVRRSRVHLSVGVTF